jgi:NADH:ubiquinone oxidoreductase subunit F (NADH-binding)
MERFGAGRRIPPVSATTIPLRPVPSRLPRLLAGRNGHEPLAQHLERLGPLHDRDTRRGPSSELIGVVAASGVRGRGGSGFPTAAKLQAVADGRGPRVVVANGMEGEPASDKDAYLLAYRPHLVLDGIVAATAAVGADQAILAVDSRRQAVVRAVERALAERRAADTDGVAIRLVKVPSRYVAGEESALIHWVNGGDAKPTFVPPRPFTRGVRGRPTLVQNVETLADLALIARFGAEWYGSIGHASEPGTALCTISGAVAKPGVCEIATGTTVGDLVRTAGGATGDIGAVLTGGYFGTWLPAARAWDLPLGHDTLARAGAAFGCGVVYVLPARVCGLAETARIARYLAEETAGQCGPCIHGLTAIAGALDAVASGRQVEHHAGLARRWIDQVTGRGACRMPDGAARLVTTALDVFAGEVARHADRGACPAARRRGVMPIPDVSDRGTGWR